MLYILASILWNSIWFCQKNIYVYLLMILEPLRGFFCIKCDSSPVSHKFNFLQLRFSSKRNVKTCVISERRNKVFQSLQGCLWYSPASEAILYSVWLINRIFFPFLLASPCQNIHLEIYSNHFILLYCKVSESIMLMQKSVTIPLVPLNGI